MRGVNGALLLNRAGMLEHGHQVSALCARAVGPNVDFDRSP